MKNVNVGDVILVTVFEGVELDPPEERSVIEVDTYFQLAKMDSGIWNGDFFEDLIDLEKQVVEKPDVFEVIKHKGDE